MKSWRRSLSTARSRISSTGSTPRSAAASATVGFGGTGRSKTRICVVVRAWAPRRRWRARSRRGVATSTSFRRNDSSRSAASCSSGGSARTSLQTGRRSKGVRLRNESTTEMPRLWVWPNMRPPAARGGVDQVGASPRGRSAGAHAERHRHPRLHRQVAHPDRALACARSGSMPRLNSVAISKMPVPRSPRTPTSRQTSSHDASRDGDRSIVGRLVLVGARRGEPDRTGLHRVAQLVLHERELVVGCCLDRRRLRPSRRCAARSVRSARRS